MARDSEAAEEASRRRTLQTQLTQSVAHTAQAVQAAGGALFVVDPETGTLDLAAHVGEPPRVAAVLRLVETTLGGGVPVIADDLEPEDGTHGEASALLVVPLRAGGDPLGCLALWSPVSHPFDAQCLHVAAAVAGQVALLVESHRLHQRAEHRIILGERARLAREIHDGLAQTLSYLKLRTAQIARWSRLGEHERTATELEEMEGLLAAAYADVRLAIDGLRLQPGSRPIHIEIAQVVSDFQRSGNISIQAALPAGLSLPIGSEIQLLRIVQEALNNVRKHATARHVWIEGVDDERGFTLSIADDGLGIAPSAPSTGQHGLDIMRERAELLDGSFQVVSRPGAGTTVVVRLPAPGRHAVHAHA